MGDTIVPNPPRKKNINWLVDLTIYVLQLDILGGPVANSKEYIVIAELVEENN